MNERLIHFARDSIVTHFVSAPYTPQGGTEKSAVSDHQAMILFYYNGLRIPGRRCLNLRHGIKYEGMVRQVNRTAMIEPLTS
jgi:hypothetical protein